MAAKVPAQVESNIRERFAALRSSVDKEIAAFRKAIDKAIRLMPVQAAVGFLGDTLSNIAELTTKQAEITRRWLK